MTFNHEYHDLYIFTAIVSAVVCVIAHIAATFCAWVAIYELFFKHLEPTETAA